MESYMEESPLHKIMKPKSIAWAGASDNPAKMGTIQLLNLMNAGFQGKVYPLHPTEKSVLGFQAFQKATDLPEVPDLAVLVVPTRVVVPLLEDLGKRGVKRAIVTTAGFNEMGEEGSRMEEALVAMARQYGIRFLGPNCIGTINVRWKLNTTFFPMESKPGPVGLASQSGTYVTQTQSYLKRHGIAFSQAMSVGNEASIDVVDCMDYLADEEDTRVILLYLESLRRPRKFLEVAQRVTRSKPVLALYVGGTEAGGRSGKSHTGAMAGNDQIYDGLFRQSGVTRVRTVEELYTIGFTLACLPPLKGPRIGILSHSGGPVTSIADACERIGLSIPVFSDKLQESLQPFLSSTASSSNPVDLTFSPDPAVLAREIPRRVLESDEVDGVIIHGIMGSSFWNSMASLPNGETAIPPDAMEEKERKHMLELASLPLKTGKPVVCSSFMDREDSCTRLLQDNGIPVLYGPEKTAGAMSALYRAFGGNTLKPAN